MFSVELVLEGSLLGLGAAALLKQSQMSLPARQSFHVSEGIRDILDLNDGVPWSCREGRLALVQIDWKLTGRNGCRGG